MKKTDWFTDWFNTSYYHTLYKDRNDADAQLFIRNITSFLKIPNPSHILDLPCGKGRHSIYLNSLGYNVTGADLSENSILFAKKFENDTLHFEIKDMRKPLAEKYDAIFNLFTSFGYFENDIDDILVLKNIKNGLKKEGVFVFDFLNVVQVKNNLVVEETKTIQDITFHITRKIENGFIIKTISFQIEEVHHFYTERVKYLDIETLKKFFQKVGFTITAVFGDYHLSEFNAQNSKRLILIAK